LFQTCPRAQHSSELTSLRKAQLIHLRVLMPDSIY